jgi:hypothetical protein
MGDVIVRHACGGHQRHELDQGLNGHEDRPSGQRGTGHAIGHPDRNRGRALIVLAQPDLTALSNAALHGNRLAV